MKLVSSGICVVVLVFEIDGVKRNSELGLHVC